jgi:hypothetical protein
MELRVFSFTYKGYMKHVHGKYDLGYVLEKKFFPIVMNVWMI